MPCDDSQCPSCGDAQGTLDKIAGLLSGATQDLKRDNDTWKWKIEIREEDLRAIIEDAIGDLRRVTIRADRSREGYEPVYCVGGDYVDGDDVKALADKIMSDVKGWG